VGRDNKVRFKKIMKGTYKNINNKVNKRTITDNSNIKKETRRKLLNVYREDIEKKKN
jgi:hypothetical protein